MATKDLLSPLPGTFYRKPSPDAAPYKNEGDAVKKGEVIGLIEVMKSFHEVHADCDGTITAFHADNEDAVMAGQPLATISL